LEPACRTAGLSAGQYSELMNTVILPLLDEPEKPGIVILRSRKSKEDRLKEIVEGLRKNRIDAGLEPVGANPPIDIING
jgi:hypothetical protein